MWNRGVVGLTCLPVTQEIAGSNPVGSAIIYYEPLAQSVEHLTFNQGVEGSNPSWLTISYEVCACGGIGRRTRLRI
jgi:hypothetical protein